MVGPQAHLPPMPTRHCHYHYRNKGTKAYPLPYAAQVRHGMLFFIPTAHTPTLEVGRGKWLLLFLQSKDQNGLPTAQQHRERWRW